MTVTREEFAALVASLRELKEITEQNTADLKIQFERIAQMQAELDRLASKSRKKATPPLPVAAADRRSRLR